MSIKNKRPSLDDFKKEARKNKNYLNEYNKLEFEFDLIDKLIIARKRAKISQAELADKLHTKQPAIARFENGGCEKASISKIQKYVNALGYDLDIRIIPMHSNSSENRHR